MSADIESLIRADLEAGVLQRVIMEQRGVTKHAIRKVCDKYDLRREREPAVALCRTCGIAIKNPARMCRACVAADRNRRDPTEDDALPPGRWVLRGGVRKFVPDEPVSDAPVLEFRREPPRCGTERGYQAHRTQWRNHGIGTWPLPEDDPCGCRKGHTDFNRGVAAHGREDAA